MIVAFPAEAALAGSGLETASQPAVQPSLLNLPGPSLFDLLLSQHLTTPGSSAASTEMVSARPVNPGNPLDVNPASLPVHRRMKLLPAADAPIVTPLMGLAAFTNESMLRPADQPVATQPDSFRQQPAHFRGLTTTAGFPDLPSVVPRSRATETSANQRTLQSASFGGNDKTLGVAQNPIPAAEQDSPNAAATSKQADPTASADFVDQPTSSPPPDAAVSNDSRARLPLQSSDDGTRLDTVRFTRPVFAFFKPDAVTNTCAPRGNPRLTATPSLHVTDEPSRPKQSHYDSVSVMNSTVDVTPIRLAKSEVQTEEGFSEQLASAISRQIGERGDEGPTQMRIQLHRPDLGRLELHVSISRAHVVSVKILAQDERAQQIVQSQISHLRLALMNCGVETGQFEVGCNPGRGQFTTSLFADRSRPSTPAPSTKSVRRPVVQFSSTPANTQIDFVA